MKSTKETTFQKTYDFLKNHGWEKISVQQYIKEKEKKKDHTARIGLYGFFKLKKSIKKILEAENENIA
jgi:hypothetical protein